MGRTSHHAQKAFERVVARRREVPGPRSAPDGRQPDGRRRCARLVVSKILNHVETGVTAVYDRHSYDPEKRAALDYWGKRLEQIVSEARRQGAGVCGARG